MYSIFVTLDIEPEYIDRFKEVSLGDAQGAVRDEPGCFTFAINQDEEIPTRFYLYEVYRDEAAFQEHLETPHFKEWLASANPIFSGPRSKVIMNTVFPSDAGLEKQKPGLLDW
jgi:autoinducer 2-degrading protein